MSTDLTMILASIPSPSFRGIEVGPLNLRVYGLAIALGVLAAAWLTRRRYQEAGGDPEVVDRAALWIVLAGGAGARVGFVLPRVDRFSDDPLSTFAIWQGGLAFFGGLVGGAVGGWWALRRLHAPMGMFLTAVAPAIPLAQAFGRWGNYFNQELYGRPTRLPWGVEIELANRVPGYEAFEMFHPTFLYEVLWNGALVALLLWAGRRLVLRPGSLFLMYLVGYGTGRFWLELLRIDTEFRLLGLSRNAYNSLLIVAAGLAGLWWRELRERPPSEPADGADADEPEEPDGSTLEERSDAAIASTSAMETG